MTEYLTIRVSEAGPQGIQGPVGPQGPQMQIADLPTASGAASYSTLVPVAEVGGGNRKRTLQGLLGVGSHLTFKTVALAQAETIDAGVFYVTVIEANAPGTDLFLSYVRSSSEPSSGAKFQSADGAWWAVVPDTAVADQTTAEAGTDNRFRMTSLRVAQSLAARAAPKNRTLESYPNAVSRPIAKVTQDWANLRDWNVTYSGNEAAKIQQAINDVKANGGGRLIQDGPLTVGSEIDWGTGNGKVSWFGTDRAKCTITQTNLSAGIMKIGAIGCLIQGVTLQYSSAASAGGTALTVLDFNVDVRDVTINDAYTGMFCSGKGAMIGGLRMVNPVNTGILCKGAIDCDFSDVSIFADVATGKGATSLLRYEDQVEAVTFRSSRLLGGVRSFTSTAAVFGVSTCPAYCDFSDVYFDGASNNSIIENSQLFNFNSCWLSGGREGNTVGMAVGQSRLMSFADMQIVNCGQDGILFTSAATQFQVKGVLGVNNGAATPGSVCAAIKVGDGTNQFHIRDVAARNGATNYGPWTGKQTHAVIIGSSCTNFEVAGARNWGVTTAAVYQGTTASSTAIYSNCF